MRNIGVIVCAMIIAVGFSVGVKADEGGFTITNYDVKAQLHKDNSVDVVETIDVDFYQSRHGIYRDIPLYIYVNRDTSKALDGSSSKVMTYANKVRNLTVKGWKYDTGYENDCYYAQIGDEDVKVSGAQTYVISYTYIMPDDRLDNSDFIFYSVLGSQWNTEIDAFSFEMTFDKELPQESVDNFKVYSGESGNETNALNVDYDVDNYHISGSAYNIGSQNAITVFTNLPQGYFEGAAKTSSLLTILFMIVTFILCVIILMLALKKRRANAVETVEFYAPEGISSAEVGTIIDESADDVDMMSLIPWWAQKGYITIEEIPDKKGRYGKHSQLLLHKKKELEQDAPEYQKLLYKALFKKDKVNLADLNTKFAEKFNDAKSSLKYEFIGEKKLSEGRPQAILLVSLMAIAYALTIAFSSQVSLIHNLVWGIVSGIFVCATGIIRIILASKDDIRKTKSKVLWIIVAILVGIVVLALVGVATADEVQLSGMVYEILTVLALISAVFSGKIIHSTPYKVEMMGKLLGFKRFIETARMPQLEMLIDENPEYYYDVLPYAMVFGLTEHWAKQFENMKITEPNWYTGYDNTMFSTLYLHRQLERGIREPIEHIKADALAEAAKAASSSIGGGFAGGGGGGGGGGSW
jgi:uncharacterized membrane protein YgcG